METDRLRAFRAVVEADSLTQGARVMHRTPGAISKAIQQLEGEVGHALFYRSGRRLVLTEAGRALYAASGRVLEELRHMHSALDQEAGSEPALRLGTFEVFSTHLFGALLDQGLGDQDLIVAELPIGEIEAALRRRAIDVGLTYVPFPHRDLRFRSVAEFRFGIFARRGRFRDTRFEAIPFAVPLRTVENAPTDLLGLDAWPDDRRPRWIRHRFALLETGLQAARRGACAVFLPECVAALHNQGVKRSHQLERIPNPTRVGEVRQTVYLVTRVEERGGPWLERLAGGLRDACALRCSA